jgi:ADP-heptose:LPS heptosyltransferase
VLVRRIHQRFGLRTIEVGSTSGFEHDCRYSYDLCGRLSWLETAEVVRRSKLFIGIDSGPAHIANAVSVRGVILMGRYRQFVSHIPYSGGYGDGSRGTIVRAPGPASEVTVDEAFTAVETQYQAMSSE